MEKFLSKRDLGVLLKVSIPTIDRWRKAGMPCIKAGKQVRFDKEEVLNWLKTSQKR